MALAFLFDPNKQFQSLGGVNEVGGFLRVFLNGTDDRATTYKNFDGTLNEADIELDANGRAVVIVDNTKTYRLEVYNRLGGLMWTVSNFTAQGGSGGGGTHVSIEGTEGEVDVDSYSSGGILHFVVGLAQTIKDTLTSMSSSVTYLASGLSGKKDKQAVKNFFGSATKTVTSLSQDANGEITPTFDDISFPDYSQRFENIENEQAVDAKVIASALNDLNARMESVEDSQCDKNIGERIADALDSQNLFERGIRVKVRQAAKSLDGTTNKTVTNISQDENGVITVTYSAISFPDWTSTITAATDLCEKLANKKTTFSGFETSNTYYPTLNAVVEYLDGRLQNLGGKKITNNGQPFTSDSQLPSSTPYYGQNINTDDYAFVQDTGLASRYTAIVSGSSVSWSLDYEISLPVFTAKQQAAIDSGANSTKIGNYDSHLANTNNPHGVTYLQVGASPDTHTHQVVINGVTKTIDKTGGTPVDLGTYLTSHQDLSGYLSKTGDGSDVTASFTTAGSRNNISTGEKLSVIFGKIAKWFTDLKALAFKDKVSDSDISGTIEDTHIASASTWNGKQNALPTTGTPTNTFAINVSGSANTANSLIRAYVNKSSQTTKIWKKIATSKTFITWDACSICFLYNHSGYINDLGLDSIVSVSIRTGNAGSYDNARIDTYSYRSASETQLLRIGGTNQYEVWVKVPTTDTNMFATVLNSYGGWTINTDESQTGQLTDDEFTAYKSSNPSSGAAYNYNIVKASKSGVGSSSVPVYVDESGEIKECTSVAQKASSGSGNLAVIDGNGNYSSSGISAYDQTMLNGLTSRLGSFVRAINSFSHSFNVIFNGSDISKTLDFENTYASIKFLRFGISYVSGKISYRLPWSGASADYNGWIIAPDTQTKNGKSIVHTTHTFTVAGNTNTEELYEENELGTTGQSVSSIFEKQITTSQTVRGRLSSEIRLYNGISYKELIVHVDIGYERLSSTGAFYAFGTVTCNTDLFEND